jgi:hypothetical protein
MKKIFSFPLAILSLSIFMNQALSQLISQGEAGNNTPLNNHQQSNNDFPDFIPRDLTAKGDQPGRGEQGNKFGGKCPSLNMKLTALVPSNSNRESLRTLTAQATPTFWFYVPYSSESEFVVEFELINQEKQLINQQKKLLTNIPGIVKISLPTDSALELNQDYYWSFHIICNPEDRAEDAYVNGIVQRVNPSPHLIPAPNSTSEQRVKFYAQDGLWLETLATIIEEVCPTNSEKARQQINNLSQSEYINFEKLMTAEIDFCSFRINSETYP